MNRNLIKITAMAVLGVISLSIGSQVFAQTKIQATVVDVISGDTIKVKNGKTVDTYTLVSIKAPKFFGKREQDYASNSKKALSNLVNKKQVNLLCDDQKRCEVSTKDVRSVNEYMVANGYAWASDQRYSFQQMMAKNNKTGIFSKTGAIYPDLAR